MLKSEIEKLITAADTDAAEREARVLLAEAATPRAKAEALYLLGRVEWKRGSRGAAMSRYNEAVALDPESEAAVALEQAAEIMDFYNKDLYNP